MDIVFGEWALSLKICRIGFRMKRMGMIRILIKDY